MSPFSTPFICPERIIFIVSYPLKVRLAVLNEPKPIPGSTNRLLNRWSCSTMSFRYLIGRSSAVLVRVWSSVSESIALGIAAFLSTFMTRGDWLCVELKALQKTLLALNMKSRVLPWESTEERQKAEGRRESQEIAFCHPVVAPPTLVVEKKEKFVPGWLLALLQDVLVQSPGFIHGVILLPSASCLLPSEWNIYKLLKMCSVLSV